MANGDWWKRYKLLAVCPRFLSLYSNHIALKYFDKKKIFTHCTPGKSVIASLTWPLIVWNILFCLRIGMVQHTADLVCSNSQETRFYEPNLQKHKAINEL